MVGSFVLLWVWFIAYKGAERVNSSLPVWWHFFLAVAVVLLVFVMVRRIRRLKNALHGGDEENENGQPLYPPYPSFGPPPSGSSKERNGKTS